MSVNLSSWIIFGLCSIPDLYAKIPAFYPKIPALHAKIPVFYSDIYIFCFHCTVNVHGWVLLVRLWSAVNDNACAMCGWKWGGWGHVGGKIISQLCARNYSRAQFIAPIWGPILNSYPYPGPTGDWEGNIRGSCGSGTSQPQFRSVRWLIHIRVKWFPQIFRN